MIAVAKEAAFSAGDILLKHFGNVPKDAIREKTKNDFLSFVDEQAENIIIETIRSRFPEHSILAEESGKQDNKSDYRWIIDPLDGTKNYLSGIPVFGVSITLEYKNQPVLGVIFDPVRNELFWGEQGKGSWLNESPIKVSTKDRLQNCLIGTGFPFKQKENLATYLRGFYDIFNGSTGMRRMGAAAIDLAYLAAGRFDGFWELGLKPWDVAAGALLIKEAGGQISDFWMTENPNYNKFLLASNGKIHKSLSDILQKHFSASHSY